MLEPSIGKEICSGAMMLKVFALLALASVVTAKRWDFNIQYEIGDDVTNSSVIVDTAQNVINAVTEASEHFVSAESFEDYDTGFGATRIDDDEACYIRKLDGDINNQIGYYKAHKNEPIKITSSEELLAVPADEAEEFGERIAEFCADYPMYKLGAKGLEEGSSRTVSLQFYRCYPNGCRPVCYYTTVTIPTGTNFVFYWFFFG